MQVAGDSPVLLVTVHFQIIVVYENINVQSSCQEMNNIIPSKGKNIQGSFRKRPRDVISGIVFDVVPMHQEFDAF